MGHPVSVSFLYFVYLVNCGNLGKCQISKLRKSGKMSNIKTAEIWEKNCGNLGKMSNIKSAEIWENNAEIWQLQDLLAEIWQLIDCGNLATYCGNMNATRQ
jgi:hypothetical protein